MRIAGKHVRYTLETGLLFRTDLKAQHLLITSFLSLVGQMHDKEVQTEQLKQFVASLKIAGDGHTRNSRRFVVGLIDQLEIDRESMQASAVLILPGLFRALEPLSSRALKNGSSTIVP